MFSHCLECGAAVNFGEAQCLPCMRRGMDKSRLTISERITTSPVCEECGAMEGQRHKMSCTQPYTDKETGGSTWKPTDAKTPLDEQAGGDHYKKLVIQPIEYTTVNNLSYSQGNIIKYATRYKDKNGVEDLMKIKHYVDLILQLEYGITNPKEIEY